MKKLIGFLFVSILILSNVYAGYEQGGYYQVDNDSGLGGSGNVIGQASSVNNEIALFSGTTGKIIKRATNTGVLKATSGVISSSTYLGITDGGTGTNTAAGARVNLGIDVRSTFSNQAYQCLSTDKVVAQIGTMSASRAVTLPLASSVNAGQEIIIKDSSGTVNGTNTIVVTAAGSDLIDGATTETIAAPYGMRKLFSDGVSRWAFDKGVLRNPSPGINSDFAVDRVINGDMGTSTGWTVGANWSISGGVATHTSGSTAALSQPETVGVIGQQEKITFTLGGTMGSTCTVGIGGQTSIAYNTTGTKILYLTSTTTGALTITPATGFTGTIDSIKVQAQTVGLLTVDGGLIMNNGTLSLPLGNIVSPAITFPNNSETTYGIYSNGSTLFIKQGGSNVVAFNGNILALQNTSGIYWGVSSDVALLRNTANYLEMRNSTNNQTFGLDGSYTDASNYYRAKFATTNNGLIISMDELGTGVGTRTITFTPSGGANIILSTNPRFNGTNSTGGGTALLGTNCPAVTVSAPYTWITAVSSDGSTVYFPVWK